MHSVNVKSFEAKWGRLLEATGSKTDSALARALEILPQSVTAGRKREQIPSGWVEKVAEQFGVNASWLFFGTGAMLEQAVEPSVSENLPESTGATYPEVPVIGLAACSLAGWYNPGPLAIRMPFPVGYHAEGLFAVLAVGASMQPDGIRQGYVLFCDPTLTPEAGDAVFIQKIDGTVSVKHFKGRDDSWIHLQGWLDPDANGVQKPYTERLSQSSIASVACVVFVKRKA